MASLKCLIVITLVAIFQIVQCKVDPTIGFISPDIVADIGESLYLKYKVLFFDLEICKFLFCKSYDLGSDFVLKCCIFMWLLFI